MYAVHVTMGHPHIETQNKKTFFLHHHDGKPKSFRRNVIDST